MKKIIMMSSEESFHNNYGAALQGHALFNYLLGLGFNVEIVRYRGGDFTLRTKYKTVNSMKNTIKKIVRPTKPIEYSEEIKEKIKIREELFLKFQDETMKFYNSERINYHQLIKQIPTADYYVCGSDQIWNPFFKSERNDPGYFLKYVPKGKRKIAYAPSFGCNDLPKKAQRDLKELLADFYCISVREDSGVAIVKKYANRDAKLVLDPTMLMTPQYWKSISSFPKNVKKPYILCYRFADSDRTKKMIDEISSELKMQVISLPLSKVSLKDDYDLFFEAGPREFIGLIENAALVCTDSFHATVFSILMRTPVCVFQRESFQLGNSMNTRIESLLNIFSLKNLIVSETDTKDKILACLNIDYDSVHEKLSFLRHDSEEYLKNALKD